MKYEEKDLQALQEYILNFDIQSFGFHTILESWKKKCLGVYGSRNSSLISYLQYADARKMLAEHLQNDLIAMNEKERYPVCDVILRIMEFSDPNDREERTLVQKQAWFIHNMIKKFDFIYYKCILLEMGEDETDVVRKIYHYIKNKENRIEAADTLYEYIERYSLARTERDEIWQFIRQLEDDAE